MRAFDSFQRHLRLRRAREDAWWTPRRRSGPSASTAAPAARRLGSANDPFLADGGGRGVGAARPGPPSPLGTGGGVPRRPRGEIGCRRRRPLSSLLHQHFSF